MALAIAALISGGLSLGGGIMGARGERKQRHHMAKRLQRALKLNEAIQGRALSQQEAFSRKATAERLAGYDQARKEASRLGRQSKQTALDREKQGMASISQNMQNRGLGSTTVGANLGRGLASDTMRSLASIDEGLAGMFGDLALGRSDVQAAGTESLAQLAQQRANLTGDTQIKRMLEGGSLSTYGVPQMGQNAFQQALPGMSAAAGMYMGGLGQGGFDPQMLQWLFGGGGFMGGGQTGLNPGIYQNAGTNPNAYGPYLPYGQ